MNLFNRDMMWMTAAAFFIMGIIPWAFLGFSVLYVGLFIFALMFFIVGLLGNDEGLI